MALHPIPLKTAASPRANLKTKRSEAWIWTVHDRSGFVKAIVETGIRVG